MPPKKAEQNETDLKPVDELTEALSHLTSAQAAAVTRIATAELDGQSIDALLAGPNKICARSTYYDIKRGGWSHRPEFQQALTLARRDARSKRQQSAVDDALAELKLAAPLAARDLRRQISGDDEAIDVLAKVLLTAKRPMDERKAAINSLAEIGTWRATQALLQAASNADKEIRAAVITALGKCASGSDVHRRMADIAVLNRSDKETANKGGGDDETDIDAIGARRWAQIAPLLNQLSEEPHAEVIAPAPVSS